MKRVILLSLSILLISLGHSFAEVPCKINYQGRLIKDNVPVDGTKTMKFSIYDSAVGPTLLWSSGDVSVEVHNGLFRYVIGTDGGDLSSIDWTAGQALYLQVMVDGETLTPREELSAYPYAINSHLLEGEAKEYFLNTSADTQTKQGNLNIMGNVGIGTTSPAQKLHVAGNLRVDGAIVAPEGTLRDDGGGWIRTYGSTGWYSQSHGGGWYMIDSSWIRSYGNKNILHNTGIMRTDGTFQVGPSGNRFLVKTDGNVGIGTTSPGEKLTVAGTIESTTGGVKFPDGTLQTSAGRGFGDWTNKDSQNNPLVVNAVYKAECDGFVCAVAYGSGHGNGSIEGFTDGSNPPTTRRVGSGSGYVDVHWSGITMPVKKNDYWKVTTYRMQTPSISWIPIGSGSCVRQ